MWRGSLGVAYLYPRLSPGRASIAPSSPYSTPSSSNRTCGFPASSSPTDVTFSNKLPALLHLKPKLDPESPRLLLKEVSACGNLPTVVVSFKSVSDVRPLPPQAIPGFAGTTSLSATPYDPASPSRVAGWCGLTGPLGLPVLRQFSLYTCRRHYPGGTVGCTRCFLFQRRWPSPSENRAGSPNCFLDALSASLRPEYSRGHQALC